MFKVNNKNARTTSTFSIVSIVDFEQVNASWVMYWLVTLNFYWAVGQFNSVSQSIY